MNQTKYFATIIVHQKKGERHYTIIQKGESYPANTGAIIHLFHLHRPKPSAAKWFEEVYANET